MKRVVLSGIRATGKLHLGNYLGAMKNFAELSQDETKQCFYFIANLHTLTTHYDANSIKEDLINIVLDFISVGVNPETSVIFAQSSIPETCELNWLLGCLTSIAELERMPHYKEKRDKLSEKEQASSGLLTYPVLMAADILGINANLVPVGEDQNPHIELTRNIAKRFNHKYGETFNIPEIINSSAIRVPGLNGIEKMGKSEHNTIDLSDSSENIRKKITQAITDPSRKRRNDPGDPNVCKIYTFHSLLSSNEEVKIIFYGCKNAEIGCVDCKKILSDNIINILQPIQEVKKELLSRNNNYVEEILHSGGIIARQRIAQKIREVKEKMGVPLY